MYCPKCGTLNDEGNVQCVSCDATLPRRDSTGPPVASGSGAFGGLIPYRNTAALVGYYLAVFSIIPCFFFLGIAGFILGIIGLNNAKNRPELGGVAHSWVGIIAGGLFGFGWLLLFLLTAVFEAAIFSHTR
jgi:hypothetical protein